MKPSRILFVLMSVLLVAACGDKKAEPTATAETPAATTAAPASAAPEPTPEAAPAEITAAAFDINQIPVTDKPLGEFPFFTPPEGYAYVSNGYSSLQKGSTKEFDRFYFATSKETIYPVEGKTLRALLYNVEQRTDKDLPKLLIDRNYENAITALGGVKIFEGSVDHEKTYKILEEAEQKNYGPRTYGRSDTTLQTYVIRRPDVEVWIELNCNYVCFYTVAQKGEIKQSVGLIPASAMKDALDKEGHIALYINFDVDKATIRPESQDIVAEIAKLLESNPELKIRIEGHTDNTGEATHNQTLSENRASAVFGTLLAKGIAQNRLESKGFGATKPIADNNTEEGKAKNRRVEIVKL